MQNYIIIRKTYSEITPESAEYGDFSDMGFITEREEVSFRELVELMESHTHPSCSPNDGSIDVSYSNGFYINDYSTGTEREESIHYHEDNNPQVARYWKLAAKVNGLI